MNYCRNKRKPGKKEIIAAAFCIVVFVCLGAFSIFKYKQVNNEVGKKDTAERQLSDIQLSDVSSDDDLIVQILNVGQGLCILAKQGDTVFLYDGGPEDTKEELTYYLTYQGIKCIDVMAASHYDSDHVSGLFEVLDQFEVRDFYGPAYERDDSGIDEALYLAAEDNGCGLCKIGAGTEIGLGSAVITVLGPVYEADDSNGNSLVIRLSFAGKSFLFTGDATKEEELSLIKAYIPDDTAGAIGNSGEETGILESDVLAAAHHGSADSSCEAFLTAVSPQYAVISVGEGNEYGHPHQAALDRLENAGAVILRTDLDGTVTFAVHVDGEMTVY